MDAPQSPLMLRRPRLPAVAAPTALWAIQLAFLVWTRLFQPRIFVDDAYIHFRNSLHFARFDGLIYNPGEWIIGTTSPVYAALLGLLHAATRVDLPSLALHVNVAVDAAIIALTLLLLARAGVPLLARHAIAFAAIAEPFRIFYSAGGMEMNLFILAVLGVLESLARRRWLAAGLILGLIGWIRPEGALVWIAAALALARARDWPLLRRVAAAAVVTAALFAAGLLVAYGTIFPLSLLAKGRAPWFAKSGNSGIDFLFQLGAIFPLNGLVGFYPGSSATSSLLAGNLAALGTLALIAAGLRRLARSGQALLAYGLGGFLCGYYLLYAVASPQIFHWYFVPFLWVALLLQGAGILALFESIPPRNPALRHAPTAGVLLWAALSILTSAGNSLHHGFSAPSRFQALAFRHPGFDDATREQRYLRAADAFNAWTGDDDAVEVGCTEIGIFGYYYKGPILDAYGLVSPRAFDVLKPGIQAQLPREALHFPTSVFQTAAPDIIMLIDDLGLAPDQFPTDRYVTIANPIENMQIHVRNDRKDLIARHENFSFHP